MRSRKLGVDSPESYYDEMSTQHEFARPTLFENDYDEDDTSTLILMKVAEQYYRSVKGEGVGSRRQ